MNATGTARPADSATRFSLRSLFEYVSFCSVLATFASTIGPVPLGFLMGLGLALAARQGLLALAMFIGASLTSSPNAAVNGPQSAIQGEFIVLAVGIAVVAWYRIRRGL